MEVPVVFIHRGDVYPSRDQSYVGVALREASWHNQNVFLLGDESNEDVSGKVKYRSVYDYFEGASWLADNYVHMSGNPASFEIAATQCAFVLREFMIEEEWPVVALCESDTMVYCSMTDVVRGLGNFSAAISIPANQPNYRWSASFHASLWTLEGIEKLCQIIRDGYSTDIGMERLETKWDYHQREEMGGGICIMTFLWFLSQEVERVVNLAVVRDGTTFDHNVRVTENYRLSEYLLEKIDDYPQPIKKIVWRDGLPHGRYLPTGGLVRFNALHFNSSSKRLMVNYQTMEEAEGGKWVPKTR